jgi:hypothetical protein
MGGLITPKFLTKDLAEHAVTMALTSLYVHNADLMKPEKPHVHVAVIVPAKIQEFAEFNPGDVKMVIKPFLLFETTWGDPDTLGDSQIVGIARSKVRELWFGQQDGGTDTVPHLLYPGDTPYWGGVFRSGIAVACSGVKPWKDRWVASQAADTMIALAYDAWDKSEDKAGKTAFLT